MGATADEMGLAVAAAESNAMTRGICLALAQLHRHGRCGDSDVREVARDAGVTLEEARRAGVCRFDWQELERAGVPATPPETPGDPREKGQP